MTILFTEKAWNDYVYWTVTDKTMVKRINLLVKDCQRDPVEGIGKSEALQHQLSGYWSRRITEEHRLVPQNPNNSSSSPRGTTTRAGASRTLIGG